MKKQIYLLILLLFGCYQLMAQQFSAINNTGDTIHYRILTTHPNTVAITFGQKFGSYTGNVAIPATVVYNNETYTVTTIDIYAFYNCANLISIDIPNSITTINEFAFSNCNGLKIIRLPNSVTQIGENAFANCGNLISIEIPNSVTAIGENAFANCIGISSIQLPNALTSINNGVFMGCSGLKSITIPNSVRTIGTSAFFNCSGLNSVNIPNSVKVIGGSAFTGCTQLQSITIPNSVTTIEGSAFAGCSGLKSVKLSNTLSSIESSTFTNCSGLTTFTIPNSVTAIGTDAFSGCSGLSNITIPNSVVTISQNAFANCKQLTAIHIPNSVTSIGQNAFSGCSNVSDITIGESVTTINGSAFANIPNIKTLKWEARNVTTFPNGQFYNNYQNPFYNSNIEHVSWGNQVQSIPDYAFYNSSTSQYKQIDPLPSSVVSVGKLAFYKCKGLTTLNIGNSTHTSNIDQTKIGAFAFYGCADLTSVVIGNNVAEIGNSAFAGCNNLETVVIGDMVTSIGEEAFEECSKLHTVTFGKSLSSIGNNAFENDKSLKNIEWNVKNVIASSTTNPFKGCSNISKISIGDLVQSLPVYLFNNSSNLSELTVMAKMPPNVAPNTFEKINTATPISIPCNSKVLYQKNPYWAHFINTQVFGLCQFQLTVIPNDEKRGKVTGSGKYNAETTATAHAIANTGYSFINWNDGNADNPRNIVVTQDSLLVANFGSNDTTKGITTYALTLACNQQPMGMTIGSGTYKKGELVKIAALPNDGYIFKSWNDGNNENPRNITITKDLKLIANFDKISTPKLIMHDLQLAVNNGVMGKTIGNGNFKEGEKVEIAALANEGYIFTGWNDGNKENPRKITLNRDLKLIANFATIETPKPIMHQVNIKSNHNEMGMVIGNGEFEKGEVVQIAALPNKGFAFITWNDGNKENPRKITIEKDIQLIANFNEIETPKPVLHAVRVKVNDSQMGSVIGNGNYEEGQSVEIAALANNGYIFAGWNDGNKENPRIIEVGKEINLIGKFVAIEPQTKMVTDTIVQVKYDTITEVKHDTITNTITELKRDTITHTITEVQRDTITQIKYDTITHTTKDTVIINKAYYNVALKVSNTNYGSVAGSGKYPDSCIVSIAALPNKGYEFTTWNDGNKENPRNILLTKDVTLTANFISNATPEPKMYKLSLDVNNLEMGKAIGAGEYKENTRIQIAALPNEGFTFTAWNDGNKENPRNITLINDLRLTASFISTAIPEPEKFILKLMVNDETMGKVVGSGTYKKAETIKIVALPNKDYTFVAWNDGNKENPREITLNKDMQLMATFVTNIAPKPTTYSVKLAVNDTKIGSVLGSGNYISNDTIEIAALANEGYTFVAWNDGNKENPRQIVVTKDIQLLATFASTKIPEAKTYNIQLAVNDKQMGRTIGQGIYKENDTLQIAALANEGYIFTAWNDGNKDNPRQLIATGDKQMTAIFISTAIPTPNKYNISLKVNNELMGTVVGNGNYEENTEIQIVALPNDGYAFTAWNDGNKENPRIIKVKENIQFIANFVSIAIPEPIMHSLELTINDPEMGKVVGEGKYEENDVVQIVALANEGFAFTHWDDGNKENPRNVTINKDIKLRANFESTTIPEPIKHRVMVMVNDQKMGTTIGNGVYNEGDTAQIAAVANTGYVFSQWADGNKENPRKIIINKDWSIASIFEKEQPINRTIRDTVIQLQHDTISHETKDTILVTKTYYNLTLNSNNNIYGSVAGSGQYPEDCIISVVAMPNEGFTFVKWNDGNQENPRNITMKKDLQLIATFDSIEIEKPITYTISLAVNDKTMGSAIGAGNYEQGYNVQVVALPNTGFEFKEWSDGNNENPRNITLIKDLQLTANFESTVIPEPTRYNITLLVNDGNMGGTVGEGSYAEGANIQIAALPYEGYTFTHWNDGNKENPRKVTITKDMQLTATFMQVVAPKEITHQVRLDVNDKKMGRAIGEGIFIEDSNTRIAALPYNGFEFLSWDDGNQENPRNITVSKDLEYIATFVSTKTPEPNKYAIKLVVNDKQMGSTIGNGIYKENDTVQIAALPNDGFAFTAWNDGNKENPRKVIMKQNVELLATFVSTAIPEPNTYNIKITVNDTSMGKTIGNGHYIEGSKVQIAALPQKEHTFTAWNDGNKENPRTIVVEKDLQLMATFISTATPEPNTYNINLTVNDPAMGKTVGNGNYEEQVKVEIAALPNEGYSFTQWNDGNTENPRNIIVDKNIELSANFISNIEPEAPTYKISLTVNDKQMGMAVGDGDYEDSSEVQIVALPNEGYKFTTWNDGNKENPRTITVTKNTQLVANFISTAIPEPVKYHLTITSNDKLMGNTIGSGIYNADTTIQIAALANETYGFTQWSDGNKENPRNIKIDKDLELSANFISTAIPEPIMITLGVNSKDNQMGTTLGSGSFEKGTRVQIAALPNDHYAFTQWSDGNKENPRYVTLNKATELTAEFENTLLPEPNRYTLTLATNDKEMGMAVGEGTYEEQVAINIVALPNEGYTFTAWDDGNKENPRTIKLTKDTQLGANFEKQQPTHDTIINIKYDTITQIKHDTITHKIIDTVIAKQNYYDLAVTASNKTYGTVAGNGSYLENHEVSIAAIANQGYAFTEWSDGNKENPRRITLTDNISLTANFEKRIPERDTIIQVKFDTITNTVTELLRDTITQVKFDTITQIKHDTITNTIKEVLRDTIKEIKYDTITHKSVDTVRVQQNYYNLTIVTNNQDFGMVAGSGRYPDSCSVAVAAIPNKGYAFTQWNDGNKENPRTIMVTKNMSFTATFEIKEPERDTIVKFDTITNTITQLQHDTVMQLKVDTITQIKYDTITNTVTELLRDTIKEVQRDTIKEVLRDTIMQVKYDTITNTVLAHTDYFYLNISANNKAFGNVAGSGKYPDSCLVSIAAIPNKGYAFTQWNDGKKDNPRTIMITKNTNLTANFIEQAPKRDTVVQVKFDTITNTIKDTITQIKHDTITNTVTELLRDTITQIKYDTITNTVTELLHDTITQIKYDTITNTVTELLRDTIKEVLRDTIMQVKYDTITNTVLAHTDYFYLNISANNKAFGNVAGSGKYPDSCLVSIAAIPNKGYAFTQWNDGKKDNPRTIMITKNTNLTANFIEQTPERDTVVQVKFDTITNTIKDTITQIKHDTITNIVTELLRDTITQIKYDTITNTVTELLRDTIKEIQRDTIKEVLRDTIMQVKYDTITNTVLAHTDYFYLNISTNNKAFGNVAGSGKYPDSCLVSIAAIPNKGYAFTQWNDGKKDNPRTIMITKNTNLTANFIEQAPERDTIVQIKFDTITNTIKDTITNTVTELLRDTITQIKYDTITNTVTELLRDTIKEIQRDTIKEVLRDTIMQVKYDTITNTVLAHTDYFYLNISANNKTFGNVAGSGKYPDSCLVSIAAIPNKGYAFTQWNDGKKDNPRTIMITKNTNLTANFIEQAPERDTIVQVKFDTITNTITQLQHDTIMQLKVDTLTQIKYDTITNTITELLRDTITQIKYDTVTNTIKELVRDTITQIKIKYDTINHNTTDTIIVNKNYYNLILTSNNKSYGNVAGNGRYPDSCIVSIAAIPNKGYVFTKWNDGNTENPRTIMMNKNRTMKANFAVQVPEKDTIVEVKYDTITNTITQLQRDTIMQLKVDTITQIKYDTITNTITELLRDTITKIQRDTITKMQYDTITKNITDTILVHKKYYNLTIKTNNNDYGSVAGNGQYPDSCIVTIAALPNNGYRFNNWNDGNKENPRMITIRKDLTLIANFIEQKPERDTIVEIKYDTITNTVTQLERDTIMQVKFDTITQIKHDTITNTVTELLRDTIMQLQRDTITKIQYDTVVNTLTQLLHDTVMQVKYDTITHRLVDTIMVDKKYYNLAITTNNDQYGSVAGNGQYPEECKVSIAALPKKGFAFDYWSDGNKENPRNITLTKDMKLIAHFINVTKPEPKKYMVKLGVKDPNMGTIFGNGAYVENTPIQIAALPNTGYIFTGWNDGNKENPRNITITKDLQLEANFATITTPEPTLRTINLIVSDQHMGKTVGNGSYEEGATIQIAALPNEGFAFLSWSDGNIENPRYLTITEDLELTANFMNNTTPEPIKYNINLAVNDTEMGTTIGSGTYKEGDIIQIAALPKEGKRFSKWNDGNKDNPRQIIVTENSSYIASFETIAQQKNIEKVVENDDFSIEYDPVTDIVTIFTKIVDSVTVYNFVGQKVAHYDKRRSFSMSNHPRGQYSLLIKTPTRTVVYKITKN